MYPALVEMYPALLEMYPALVEMYPALVEMYPALLEKRGSAAPSLNSNPAINYCFRCLSFDEILNHYFYSFPNMAVSRVVLYTTTSILLLLTLGNIREEHMRILRESLAYFIPHFAFCRAKDHNQTPFLKTISDLFQHGTQDFLYWI